MTRREILMLLAGLVLVYAVWQLVTAKGKQTSGTNGTTAGGILGEVQEGFRNLLGLPQDAPAFWEWGTIGPIPTPTNDTSMGDYSGGGWGGGGGRGW